MSATHPGTDVCPPSDPVAHRTNRRTLLRAVAAGAIVAATTSARSSASHALANSQASTGVRVFPPHGTWTASPFTEISFRGLTQEQLGTISVLGADSGGHSGIFKPHADGNGVSFLPDSYFESGEVVTVRAGTPLASTDDGALTFGVIVPAELPESPTSVTRDDPEVPPHEFHSRPDLKPPVFEITTPATGTAEGYVFLSTRVTDGQSGATIVDNNGEILWFGPDANPLNARYDVRVQEYLGEPVITFVEGNGPRGYRFGHFCIYDSTYQPVLTFPIGNGLVGGDLHEFILTPQGTALIGAYQPVVWDLSPVGGSKYGNVLDGVIQEIEPETGRVLFEWHSLDHISVEESHYSVPDEPDGLFDYLHPNSIGMTPDGNIIMSGRHTFTAYKIDSATGDVIWRLNGRESDFEMGEGAFFSWQHDARIHDNGLLTLFDNAATGPSADVQSRGIVLDLDTTAMTATLVREYVQPEDHVSGSQGNMQVLPNGNVFIGWGSAPNFSEFTEAGDLIFDGTLPEGGSSYRAYRFPWTGQPSDPPDVAVEADSSGGMSVFASWNGATGVASWQVLAGSDPGVLQVAGSAPRAGFETTIPVESPAAYVAVQALDASGAVLGTSEAVTPA